MLLTFNQFKKIISEALNDAEKASVDKWERGDNSFSDHVFHNNPREERRGFELEHPESKSEHQERVEEHLGKHGISVKDYKEGKATDKHGREVNIGRALVKTKAEDHLKRGFENDPSRQRRDRSNLHVSLSRHRHDVAGMTSKGQSWENESCMNFHNGSNRRYLKEDVKHGTHVAYLTDKDDHENQHPLARIALKRYTNVDDPHDHILRPEHRTYGDAPDAFHHTVNKIVNKHFPGREDAIYRKNENVYDDSDENNNYIIGKKAIGKALDHPDADVRKIAASHPNATSEHLHKALNDGNVNVRRAAARHPNVTSEHLDKALNDKSGHVRYEAASHPNATSKHLHKALNDGDEYVRAAAARNHNATSEHLDKALNDKSEYVREAAARHPNATSEHLHKALSDDNVNVRQFAIRNPNITHEHLHKALNDESEYVRYGAASNRNATSEHLHKALDDKIERVRRAAIKNPNATSEHLHKALNDVDEYIRDAAKEMLQRKNES